MANKLLRPIAAPFQVVWRGQTVDVTHEKAFVSGGYADDFHVQWTKGFINGLGEFVKVVVREEPRTLARGYRLLPADVQAIMDNPTSGEGNFTLEELVALADTKDPVIFNLVAARDR